MGMQIHQILLLFWFTKQLRCDVKGCMFHYFNKWLHAFDIQSNFILNEHGIFIMCI